MTAKHGSPLKPPADGEYTGVPLLRLEAAIGDLVAAETWREALSDSIREDLPHELFALWLYPPGADPVLMGPAELAQDNIRVPIPTPMVPEYLLGVLEALVGNAGYRSVRCRAIRHGQHDVGLLLIAALRGGVYGPEQDAILAGFVTQVAPTMARLARQWHSPLHRPGLPEAESEQPEAQEVLPPVRPLVELFSAIGRASVEASTPRHFVQAVSHALAPLLPHDCLELLVPDPSGERWYQVGEHGAGPLWAHSNLVVTRDQLDLTSVFGAADTLLMKDTLTDRRGSVWSPGTVSRAGEKPRSALGVRLRAQDRTIGYLLVGALGPSFFRREDLTLLEEVGALVVARVETLLLTWQEMVLRGQLSILRSVPAQLAKLAEILATTPQLPDALRAFKGAAASILSFETLTVAVTVGDEDHVIILEPGDATPLKELTPVGIAGTPTARVIRREMAYAFTGDPRGTDLSSTAWLVVPLRVGGQIVGALNVLAPGSQVYNRADVSLAQQIADVAAPHLQLIRRSAGWTLPLNETWGRGRGR